MAKTSNASGNPWWAANSSDGQVTWPRPDKPAWEKTPWWNWHRWFGLDLRRPHGGVGWTQHHSLTGRMRHGGQWWEYGNSKKVARNVLSSLYEHPRHDNAGVEVATQYQYVGRKK